MSSTIKKTFCSLERLFLTQCCHCHSLFIILLFQISMLFFQTTQKWVFEKYKCSHNIFQDTLKSYNSFMWRITDKYIDDLDLYWSSKVYVVPSVAFKMVWAKCKIQNKEEVLSFSSWVIFFPKNSVTVFTNKSLRTDLLSALRLVNVLCGLNKPICLH